jgi:hypothetical protein
MEIEENCDRFIENTERKKELLVLLKGLRRV